jgi:hypothetical protein
MRKWPVLRLGSLPRAWLFVGKFELELKIKIAELANVEQTTAAEKVVKLSEAGRRQKCPMRRA